MKKILAIILAVAMCLSLGTAAFAAEDILLIAPAPARGVNVNVTIADAGDLVLVQAPVSVTDLDEDGIVSINDALMAAHLAYYPGEAGYVYYSGNYGLAIDTLWGVTNGGSYMYYVNDLMPMSLGEEVKEGDSIVAYGFADLEYWGDTYTFFDVKNAAVTAGDTLELTLSAPDWDGNVLPVAGAELYVDGAASGIVTDENGKAAVTFDKAGEYLVSAKSETAVLVPPACKVKVVPSVVDVSVTISDAGDLVLVQAPVSVTDLDEDGAITINDALIAAHAVYYKDGTAGYVYYSSDYGLAIDTLWGVTNGGSYMYYVNNLMPMSLGEAIDAGDSIVAYGFADLEYWGDQYTYFDKRSAEVSVGDALELTLSAPDWSGNVLPVAGAEIVVDGVKTGVVTDENGKAAITLDKVGSCVVSAKSESAVLVPPACKVAVGFTDIAEGDTYAEAVNYLVAEGLVNGIEDTSFNASAAMGRGDFTALVWNLEGAPVVNYLMMFNDVAAEKWYTEAIRWAAAEDIVEGYSDTECAPVDELTCEQAAVILWRYAKHEGIDVTAAAEVDTTGVSEWAVEAVQWACGAGLITADEPAAALTRGEAAQLIYDFAAYIG